MTSVTNDKMRIEIKIVFWLGFVDLERLVQQALGLVFFKRIGFLNLLYSWLAMRSLQLSAFEVNLYANMP